MGHKIMVSHECPISLLEESIGFNDYGYALVHLLEQQPKYKSFYKTTIKEYGKEVLLDNSIFELGKAFESSKFAAAVEEMEPNYYIVPDVLEDGYATVNQFSAFTKEYSKLKGLKIGVVQGKTYDELVDCYKYMSDNADYLAISFDYSYYIATGRGTSKLERWCNGRQNFIQDLINDGFWDWSKPHHLLGNSLPQEMKYYCNENIHNIRTVDTSNPIVAGIKGLRYCGDLGLQEKPSQKLADMITHDISTKEYEDIMYNVGMYKKILNRL